VVGTDVPFRERWVTAFFGLGELWAGTWGPQALGEPAVRGPGVDGFDVEARFPHRRPGWGRSPCGTPASCLAARR